VLDFLQVFKPDFGLQLEADGAVNITATGHKWTSSTQTWNKLTWEATSLLSPHADRHAGDISFTVCLSAKIFVRDISGVGWHRVMKF